MTISRSIVETVRTLDPPGRFLEKDPSTGLWYDIGDKKAVEKTSQALRDGAACLRKQLSMDASDSNFLKDIFAESGPNGKPPKSGGKKKGKGHRRTNSMPSSVASAGSTGSSSSNKSSSTPTSTPKPQAAQAPALKKQRSIDYSAIVTSASADEMDEGKTSHTLPTLSPRFSGATSPRFSVSTPQYQKQKKRGHKRSQSASAIPTFHPASPTPNNVNPMHYQVQSPHVTSPTATYSPYHSHSWRSTHGPPPPPPHLSSPNPYSHNPVRQPYLPTSPTGNYHPGQDQLSPLPYSYNPPRMYSQPQHSWSGPSPMQHSNYAPQPPHPPPPPPSIQQSYSQGAMTSYHAPPPMNTSAPAPAEPIHISPNNYTSSYPNRQYHHHHRQQQQQHQQPQHNQQQQQHFFPSPGGTLSSPPPVPAPAPAPVHSNPASSHIPPSPSSHTMSPSPPDTVTSLPPPPPPPVPSLYPSNHTSNPSTHNTQPSRPEAPQENDALETSFSQSETSFFSNPNLIDGENILDTTATSASQFQDLLEDRFSPNKHSRISSPVKNQNPQQETVGSFDDFPSPLPYEGEREFKRSESPTLLFGSLSEHILSLPLDSPPSSPVRNNKSSYHHRGGDIWRDNTGVVRTTTTTAKRSGGRNQEHVRQVSDPPLPPFETAP
mmetsp:Transcript_11247/g.16289  ORF Transcript_11247/g.16289 Transcript_11247/m.16289 type:complete len:658 (-) Transcript_11247:290-2263(-)